LFQTAQKYNKMLHIHVDQFNDPAETETELVCQKTAEYGWQGNVAVIHSISLAAHPKSYRECVYTQLRDNQVMVVACPTAWIDTPRSEGIQPFHNALTPAEELVAAGCTIALGTDNMSDHMVPWSVGEMWPELHLLCAGTRLTDLNQAVQIATSNGRKVLGLSTRK
jgi:cytosine/adenosine deaminase-related metal-dependent hydrolase